jgi:hypothetical protein
MRLFFLVIVFVSLSTRESSAQTFNVSNDSVKQILCRKWVISRITVSGQPINTSGLATTYDFKSDYTVTCVWEKGVKKGVWAYDSATQIVHITMKKKNHLYVKSLSENEFELATDIDDDPNEIFPSKIYFRPVRQN